jgi:hypothetical protein
LRINEFTSPEDQLALLKILMDGAWAAFSWERQIKAPTNKPYRATPLKKIVKAKATPKPKKAPYAAAPKPLPKPKPIPQTPTQIKHQQHKYQQDYAQAVKKTFDKDMTKMPKSLQPLPTNIVSPIGGGDPEFNKKLELARKQGEQNRSNDSKPHSY